MYRVSGVELCEFACALLQVFLYSGSARANSVFVNILVAKASVY
jgi:hypothetical protein